MRRLIKFPLAVAAIAAALFVASPAFAVNPSPHDILGSGSDTTYFMMSSHLDVLYNSSTGCRVIALTGDTQPLDNGCLDDTGTQVHTENYAHDRVSEAAPLGSSVGILQLCSQGQTGVAHIDFARSSRAPRNPDSCTGLHFVAYARDGLSWESFPGESGSPAAGVTNLTVNQLKGVFTTCTNTHWSDIGGVDSTPIVVWAAQTGSGTRSTWDGFLGGNSTTCIPAIFKDGDPTNGEHVIAENNDAPIFNPPPADPSVPGDAIFYYSWGRYNEHHAATSYLGMIEGVAPTKSTISSGTFPFSRYLFNIYCGAAGGCGTAPQAPSYVTNYIGEQGWICNQQATAHATDPLTGANYGREITAAINNSGFAALKRGLIGGGVSGKSNCRLFTT
jgi:ABC-type phosphate transport system substrate-binding protein